MSLSLVIMAAGLGSRFGGNKPLAAVGPDGQSLFEFSVYDAFRAGIKHIVFVVNEQQDTTEFSDRLKHYAQGLKIEFVVQSLRYRSEYFQIQKKLDRVKPWGTAHAVLVCREHIQNPFIVINADDYYGPSQFKKIGRYLLDNASNAQCCALPGYRLENTLSRSGGVNRGVCQIDSGGFLESIQEVKNIRRDQTQSLQSNQYQNTVSLSNNAIVSMTFWGFMPSVFRMLDAEFMLFLKSRPDLSEDEFLLPEIINRAIKAKGLSVKMFETLETWKGLTFAEDTTEVRAFISKLTASGLYSDFGQSR